MNWLVTKAHAANNWDFITPTATSTATTSDIGTILSRGVNIITLIAGALAIIYMIYSGILYITAAGNPDSAKKGQQGVINAIIGVVIIVFAYFILHIVVNIAGNYIT